MKEIKENWQWYTLNLGGATVMAVLSWQFIAAGWFKQDANSLLVESGKWAIRFLLFCLLMTPLNTLLGWRNAIQLRKPAGLWAFGFVVLHFLLLVTDSFENWLQYPIPDYTAGLGVIGLAILTMLAITSNRWAMKRLGRWWKRLHRLVYAAGILAVTHALLEVPSKRVAASDPQAGFEIRIYLAILILLLLVRIPLIRSTLVNLRHHKIRPPTSTPARG